MPTFKMPEENQDDTHNFTSNISQAEDSELPVDDADLEEIEEELEVDETEEEVEEEVVDEDDSEEEEAEEIPSEPTVSQVSKGLQNTQQKLGNLERNLETRVNELVETINSLSSTIQNQRGSTTPDQQEQIEEAGESAKDILAEFEGLADDEVVDVATMKRFAQAMKSAASSTNASPSDGMSEVMDRMKSMVAEQDARAANAKWVNDFNAENANSPLAGKGDEVVTAYLDELDSMTGGNHAAITEAGKVRILERVKGDLLSKYAKGNKKKKSSKKKTATKSSGGANATRAGKTSPSKGKKKTPLEQLRANWGG